MKTRTKRLEDTAPAMKEAPKLVSVGEPKKSGRGGFRPGAGRKPYLKEGAQKKRSAYVSLTDPEKEKFEKLAEKRGLTLSYYLRERLGLPIDE